MYVKFGADLIEQNDVSKEQSNEMKVDERWKILAVDFLVSLM